MNDPNTPKIPDIGEIAQSLERTLANLANHNRRGKSNWPYYKSVYGDEIMATIEDVLSTGQPQIWPCTSVTASTLQAKWVQGCNWLRDNDPDSVELINAVEATKLDRVGLRVAKRRGAHIPRHYQQVAWKPKLLNFLADSVHKDKLEIACALTQDDLKEIESLLNPVMDQFIIGQLDNDGMLIIRFDRERGPK